MWTFHELIHAAPRSKQADDLLAARALHEAAILVGIPSEPIGGPIFSTSSTTAGSVCGNVCNLDSNKGYSA
jgi:hypothetical protein